MTWSISTMIASPKQGSHCLWYPASHPVLNALVQILRTIFKNSITDPWRFTAGSKLVTNNSYIIWTKYVKSHFKMKISHLNQLEFAVTPFWLGNSQIAVSSVCELSLQVRTFSLCHKIVEVWSYLLLQQQSKNSFINRITSSFDNSQTAVTAVRELNFKSRSWSQLVHSMSS